MREGIEQGGGSTRENGESTLLTARGGDTRKTQHVKAKKGWGWNRKSHNGCTYPIDIRLLLRKAEMRQTLVLDFLQQVVSKKCLDLRVLERFVGGIFLSQSRHVLFVQQAGREVLGAEPRLGLFRAICVGGRG